ncbi:MAG: hypothetical protein IPL87_00220 [Candidatus Moraniibacteriota bacterium]|nr:MAG: hypothetical protein IPL87_00220 [Candidatus Moranbacteria bacterium]
MTSVLDVPRERQEELASSEEKTREQWVEEKKSFLDILRSSSKKIRKMSGKKLEGWTDEDEKKSKKISDESRF